MSGDLAELRQIIARLSLMSHAPAANLEGGAPSSENKGGRRPPGGIDRRDDAMPEFRLKSADHFRRRLARARSDRAVHLILLDARQALEAWTHSPPPTDPEPGTYHWKLQIVHDIETGKRTIDQARQFYVVSRASVYRYLRAYGRKAAA